jgi:LPS sulfotransferase NodH
MTSSLPQRRLFFVVGVQRTGTTLLREILNSHGMLMMMAEVLLPYPDSCHWDHFAATVPSSMLKIKDEKEGFALLDRYFHYIHADMTARWKEPHKTHAVAFGVDIKCEQLCFIQPTKWPKEATPFLLHYAMSRKVMLINTIRRNVIHCAISHLIAFDRDFWHNYDNRRVEQSYAVDIGDCLSHARSIMAQQRCFELFTQDYPVQVCEYEALAETVAAAINAEIPPDCEPLRSIASAFGIPCRFHFHGRLHRAINRPYRDIIANHSELVAALECSEFAAFARTI